MHSSDEALNDEYRRYCLSVGHLFLAFARLENVLTSALKLHLALNLTSPEDPRAMKLAAAIYGSQRYKAARDTIKRLLDIEEPSAKKRSSIEQIFAHVGHIEQLRDKIAHQMVVPAHRDIGGFWQVSDFVTTRDAANPRVWTFDTDAIGFAADDLILAYNLLGGKAINQKLFGGLPDFLAPSWRYKSSMLRAVPRSKLKAPPPP